MKTILSRKKLIADKLLSFGFRKSDGSYVYVTDLIDGQFEMTVTVTDDGTLNTSVVDKISEEEYVLHLTDEAAGAFVGRVREEYEAVLDAVVAACCEEDVFKSAYAKRLIGYVRNTYGDEPEYLWEKFPDNAIWRRKDNRKWYAALLTVSRRKLGQNSDEVVEIIDLRMKPDDVTVKVDHKRYFPGWHMNKKNWITIILDGSVGFEEICRRLDESYIIAKK